MTNNLSQVVRQGSNVAPRLRSVEQNTGVSIPASLPLCCLKLLAGTPAPDQQVSTNTHGLEKALRIVNSNRSISNKLAGSVDYFH